MYLPKQFDHPSHARRIIRENPLASLISNDDDGFPFVTHLPIKLQRQSSCALPPAKTRGFVDLHGTPCLHVTFGLSRFGSCAHLELSGRACQSTRSDFGG